MPNKPFISIITPTYNRADLIPDTIRSLQQQEYDNYEIIIVDDGSTDNTEEVVLAMADARTIYVKKQNAERAAARNFGARMAKGEYINFFDSDDIALRNHLSEAVKIINSHNNPEWFHLGFAWTTEEGEIFKKVNEFAGETLNSEIVNGNPLSCNGVFLRKDICLAEPFIEDRELSASEDYELWIRLAARYPLYFTNTITSHLVDHDTRSVRTINGKKLIKRFNLLIYYLRMDPVGQEQFRDGFRKIIADCYSYVSLHLAEVSAYKLKSIWFLLKSLYYYPGFVTRRRFYAIIKNFIIKWQGS
jgi:glycosyltransferase involved in cell wall biosynthesis